MTLRVADHAAASDVGRMRRANEDSYFVRAPLFAVADGMGGAQAGEVASKLAVDALAAGLDESLVPERRLKAAVSEANGEIHRRSIADPALHGMGTTLTAALLGDDELTLAHVGDSRAYRLRDGELTRLTTDHSLVGEMVRRGAISEAEAEQHPQRSILTRALGPESEVEIDTLSYGVRDGDVYVICSDGLTTMIDDAQIAEVAGSGDSMREIAERLIARANAAGGVDNITVIAFKVAGRGGARESRPRTPAGDLLGDESGDEGRTIAAPAVKPTPDPPTPPTPPETPRSPRTAAGGNGRVAPRLIEPGGEARARARRKSRLRLGVAFGVVVFLLAAIGAVAGSLNVYFIGVDEHGLLTVYRGLPYEGPLAMQMYTKDYVSVTPADSLRPAQRATLLDHSLRTRADALDLITQVERGQLKPADAGATPGSGAP